MKNRFLWLLILGMALFAGCSDDDDDPKLDLNASYASSELNLTYSGEAMSGKYVTFNTNDGKIAEITLGGANISLGRSDLPVSGALVNPGVVPGESMVKFSVVLQQVGNGYTFEGEHQAGNYVMNYKGAVEKGKLSLALDVTFEKDELMGDAWPLRSYNPYGQAQRPLHAVWNSTTPFSVVLLPIPGAQPMDLQPGDLITLVSAVGMIPVGDKKISLNEALLRLLKSVTFRKDGNIVASYSDAVNMASPEFQDSPLNLAHYALKNGKLYLYLNVDAIIATMQQAKSKALDMETILPMILPDLMELLPMLSSGIPLGYTIDGNQLAVYIDKELGLKIVKMLLPLLENEEVVAAIKEAATSNPDFSSFAGIVDAILEQAPEVLSNTTEMEIGLNFERVEVAE